MNVLLTLGWQWLAGATLLVACVVYLILLSVRVAKEKKLTQQLFDRIEYLEDQLHSLRREVSGVSERNQLSEQPEQPESETAYAQAMRLAGQGLDSSAVAAGCGISRGEAELIVALYRASQRP